MVLQVTMAIRELSHSVASLSTMLRSVLRISLPDTGIRNINTSSSVCGKIKLIKQGININKYTLRPLPLPKSGGRGQDGRIWTHGIGGGAKQKYRQVDFKREGPKQGDPLKERVIAIRYDPCRTANIAIVAGGTRKRYIIASSNMKQGNVIKTSGKVTRIAVRGEEGDAYPIGSLPVGTMVHNLEVMPGQGGILARAAGTSAQLVRKIGKRCILKMPSKQEVSVLESCMATIGRVSNINHNKQIIGSAGRARWFGVRPQSGLWHRKSGIHGRKIKPLKPMKVCVGPRKAKSSVRRFTF